MTTINTTPPPVRIRAFEGFLLKTLFGAVLFFTAAGALPAQVGVFVSPNDIQSAEASGIFGTVTETFDALSAGPLASHVSSIGGRYASSGGAQIKGNDQYGGFGLENYLAIPPGASLTLTLDAPAQYFGFYFTAGDGDNRIDLYSGDNLLLEFSTATLINLLPNDGVSTVTAMNGSDYLTSNYYGQPVSGANAWEPYAYLHFVTSGPVTFDRIVLTQGTSGTGIFENDNHSLRATTPAIPDTLVALPGTEAPIPEPSAALLALGAAAGLLTRRRRVTATA